MFLGEYHVKFTGTNRVILPHKMRQQLQGEDRIVLSRGLDQCIWGFDNSHWQQQAEQQLQSPMIDQQARDMRRYLFSGAEESELDKQGRFVIPASLLRYAGIEDEVIVIGAGDHFEIWNPVRWQQTINRLEERTENDKVS